MIKYLKDKNSRRRGVALELAIFVIMLCFGLSIILVTTSMIQKNNYNRVVKEASMELDLNRIGAEFCSAVKNNNLAYFKWKLEQETEYLTDKYSTIIDNNTLTIRAKDENGELSDILLFVELAANGETYEIKEWECNIK